MLAFFYFINEYSKIIINLTKEEELL